jgi:hypothetical protein
MTTRRGCLCGIAVLAVIAGCGPSAEQQAQDGRERAASWAASTKVAVEAWAAGAVPRRYVENTIAAATNDLTKEATRLESNAGPAAAAPLRSVATKLPPIIARVQRGDRDGALREVGALR